MEFGMWVLFARAPPPDAPYWPGRRWLAAVDAVVWPGAVWVALSHFAERGGLLLALIMAMLMMSAARRLHTALLANHRYRFTTWRWGRIVIWMMVLGALLKLGLPG
jgi:hypothetical protein